LVTSEKFNLFLILGIEYRAFCMLGKH
jgi:hypothetical protein